MSKRFKYEYIEELDAINASIEIFNKIPQNLALCVLVRFVPEELIDVNLYINCVLIRDYLCKILQADQSIAASVLLKYVDATAYIESLMVYVYKFIPSAKIATLHNILSVDIETVLSVYIEAIKAITTDALIKNETSS